MTWFTSNSGSKLLGDEQKVGDNFKKGEGQISKVLDPSLVTEIFWCSWIQPTPLFIATLIEKQIFASEKLVKKIL